MTRCVLVAIMFLLVSPSGLFAQEEAAKPQLDLRALLEAGGIVGYMLVALSMAAVALIFQHLLGFRKSVLIPTGVAEQLHKLITTGQFREAEALCQQQPSFLTFVVQAGLKEVDVGYREVVKALEDAAAENAARLFRKIEYLNIIGTISPMLGLFGTVWGMIQAFLQFATKDNPPVSELAPGIYQALVTTLLGLAVAIPAIAAYSLFRSRVDELVAEASLLAEHSFSGFKRVLLKRGGERKQQRGAVRQMTEGAEVEART